MKHITDPTELINDRLYWLVDKANGNARASKCQRDFCEDNSHPDHLFFEGRIWATPENNQAMERWDIYGPIPELVAPDFETLKRGNAEEVVAELKVDELANYIRAVDGKHDMGAGILAEHILSWLGERGISIALAEGMPVTQEPKHGIRNNRLYNRSSGETIPFDEPVFVFRARDKIALQALYHYSSLCTRYLSADTNHVRAIRMRIADFEQFASQHPNRMKFPDTTPWAKS